MNAFIGEYKRYKRLLEQAVEQVSDEAFFKQIDDQGNSIAVLIKHISGNLLSRFTDFLETDGEKSWRNREGEFHLTEETRTDLLTRWENAWCVLEKAIVELSCEDMTREITIRGVPFTVEEALARSLAHFSYHVGQIIYMARYFTDENWKYLTIPPGQSEAYNANPSKEKEE